MKRVGSPVYGLIIALVLCSAPACGRSTVATASSSEPGSVPMPTNEPVFPPLKPQPQPAANPPAQPQPDGEEAAPTEQGEPPAIAPQEPPAQPEPATPQPSPSAPPAPTVQPSPSAPPSPAAPPANPATGAGEPVLSLRVQVFPHVGRYTTPEGQEATVNTITLTSPGTCQTGPVGATTLSSAASSLTFTYASLTAPVQVACSSPTTVQRETGLKSYSYEGTFQVERGDGTQVRVINILPLENYLRGVVPAEVPASWPDETLQAQAVASRTYAMYEREHHNSVEGLAPDVDVDDTVLSQAYLGLTAAQETSDQAIEDTANEVIYYDHDVISAFFSADAGGYTEDAVDVFGPVAQPYCQAKPEAYASNLGTAPWTLNFTQAHLMTDLVPAGLAKSTNPVTGMSGFTFFRSGRVNQLTLEYADGTKRVISGGALAGALNLRSTLYTVTVGAGPAFKITGRGFGHGVGMAQVGAQILAESMKWTHEQILNFYYTDVTLCRLGTDCQ